MTLLSVTEARAALLRALPVLPSEPVPVESAAGRILAHHLTAPFPLPPFSNSSMDGFAVRAADLAAAGADGFAELLVVADIPAGTLPDRSIGPGEAARIMTGAPLPEGADAVVPVERTDFSDRSPGQPPPPKVRVYTSVEAGAYVRQRGEDVSPGDILLQAGSRMRPQDVGMAAMLGVATIDAVRPPRVAILSTGDELLSPGEPLQPGKIFESNSLTLAALVEDMGATAVRLGIAADTAASVQEKLDQAVASGADIILSSAGVSVGAFDFVKEVVEHHGRLNFWRVNMRPGKPLAFGDYRGVPFVGLPGNPVSAFVGFEVFLRPALAHMSGWTTWRRHTLQGFLGEDVVSDGRESYLRARLQRENDRWMASLTGHQGSGNHFSLVAANALVVIPAGVKQLPAGSYVDIWRLT